MVYGGQVASSKRVYRMCCFEGVREVLEVVLVVHHLEHVELATPVLRALCGPHGLDILIVLIRAVAARVEGFVGVDGDTVDAYYAVARDGTHQDQRGW